MSGRERRRNARRNVSFRQRFGEAAGSARGARPARANAEGAREGVGRRGEGERVGPRGRFLGGSRDVTPRGREGRRDGTPEKKSAGRVRRPLRVREGGDFGAPDLLVSTLGLEQLDEGVAHGAPAVEQVLELPVLGLVLGARGGGLRDDAATRRRRDLPRRRFVGPPPRRGASGRPARGHRRRLRECRAHRAYESCVPRCGAKPMNDARADVRGVALERVPRESSRERLYVICLPFAAPHVARARSVTNAVAMTKCPAATGRDWPRRARGETSDARAVRDILTVREPPVRGLFRSRGNFL
jgi:hypothetical protein